VTTRALLDFATGPLFVATFAFMVMGLIRIVIKQLTQVIHSVRRLPHAEIDVGGNVSSSLSWLLPVKHLYRNRPLFSVTSFVAHVGLIVVPIFLVEHIELWRRGLGIAWPGISPVAADVFTVVVISAFLVLLTLRIFDRAARTLSSPSDYLLVLVVVAPFLSGFMAFHPAFNPLSYNVMLLVHVLSAELLFVLLPTTKLAHAALFFLGRFSSDIFWRFPVGAGDRVAAELYGAERKV
jgi:nitrate reductase gamma subunit